MNIALSFMVLIKISFQELREIKMGWEPYFWINAAILLFSLIALVILGLQQYIINNRILITNEALYSAILTMINCVLYMGYSYAFILCRIQKIR
jgi:hypothetical protein